MSEAREHRSHGRVGSTVRDKYRIDAFLATGSMANVYSATHRNGSRVALKILHRELAEDPQMWERFQREGWFANSIGHPAIARAIDDDVTEDGCPFIVMELLDGENLESLRKRHGGKLPLADVVAIADQILDVLAAAHAKDVLHRDLKPENVFITEQNEVKLLDFGVARWNDGLDSSDVTAVGMVLGTPAFMPPEQALGRREEVDARSDIWALGATLFTMITGESVHLGPDATTKLIATARTPARKLADVAPYVPRALAAVIDRALAFDKRDRWDDATAMREALRWARMSLDDEADVATKSFRFEPIGSPVSTKRAPTDDEPTVMRAATDEVYTSAPPITLRDVAGCGPEHANEASGEPRPDGEPTSAVESSEGPTFSLRNEPVFSLRNRVERAAPGDVRSVPDEALDAAPATQRLENTHARRIGAFGMPDLVPPSGAESFPFGQYTRPMPAAHPRPFFPPTVDAPPAYPAAAGAAGTHAAAGAGAAAGVAPSFMTSSPHTVPPGPLLAQVAPKKPLAARVLVPLIVIGVVGGAAAFLFVKRREAEQRTATASAAQSAALGPATASSSSAAATAPAAAPTETTTSAGMAATATARPAAAAPAAAAAAAPARSFAPPASSTPAPAPTRTRPTRTKPSSSAPAVTTAAPLRTTPAGAPPEDEAPDPGPMPLPPSVDFEP